ncbi:MAG: hypothetical protein WDA26_13125, partial [Pusillimonas sp.]
RSSSGFYTKTPRNSTLRGVLLCESTKTTALRQYGKVQCVPGPCSKCLFNTLPNVRCIMQSWALAVDAMDSHGNGVLALWQ